MAGIHGAAVTGAISTGTSAKTLLQVIAASNHRIRVYGAKISFNGTSPTAEPIKVDVLRQTSAGTMTSLTPVKKNNADDETLQTTAQHTSAGEPTAGDVLDTFYVHPQQGFAQFLPSGGEWIVPGSGRLGLRVTAPASVSAIAQFDFEE